MKAIILSRVSSKEQEETGYSLPAQEKLLREHGSGLSLDIKKAFSITESASGRKQREIFNEMLAYVKKENIKIIICEKVDRLTRNFKDAVDINDWINGSPDRQVHFVKENVILDKEAKSNEKFIWNIKVAVAQYYIDNLSEEVKKGQKEKISQGWLPTKSPPGYKTVGEKGHKTHIIDDDKSPLIIKMFELYESGQYSLKVLCEKMYEEGLRNDNGHQIVKSRIHQLLTDPFYIGKIRWNDDVHQGKHTPLISEGLFNRVQKRLTSKSHPKYNKHDYQFKGLLKCSDCIGLVTWEKQKGHIYGYCNNCIGKKGVREENVNFELANKLKGLQVNNPKLIDWIRKALKESHANEITYHSTSVDELASRQSALKSRIDRLYDDKLDGEISEEFYRRKFSEYSQELESISDSMSNHNNAKLKNVELGVSIFELSQRANEIYLKSNIEDKRKMLNLVFSEILIINGTIEPKFSLPFEYLFNAVSNTNSSKELISVKTLVENFEPSKKTDMVIQSASSRFFKEAMLRD